MAKRRSGNIHWSERANKSTVVYLMLHGEKNRLKIGITSRDLRLRRKEINAGKIGRVNILNSYAGGFNEERWLHSFFSEYHLNNEWYENVEPISKHFEAMANK